MYSCVALYVVLKSDKRSCSIIQFVEDECGFSFSATVCICRQLSVDAAVKYKASQSGHMPLYLRPDCMKDIGRPIIASWDPYSAGDISTEILHHFHTVSEWSSFSLATSSFYLRGSALQSYPQWAVSHRSE